MEQSFVVTVDDRAVDRIAEVAAALRACGMRVERVLPLTGIITGQCQAGLASRLQGVAGVHSVEPDEPVGIPPGED